MTELEFRGGPLDGKRLPVPESGTLILIQRNPIEGIETHYHYARKEATRHGPFQRPCMVLQYNEDHKIKKLKLKGKK